MRAPVPPFPLQSPQRKARDGSTIHTVIKRSSCWRSLSLRLNPIRSFLSARDTQVCRVCAFFRLAKRGNRADSSPRLARLDRSEFSLLHDRHSAAADVLGYQRLIIPSIELKARNNRGFFATVFRTGSLIWHKPARGIRNEVLKLRFHRCRCCRKDA